MSGGSLVALEAAATDSSGERTATEKGLYG